jgi:hypothetical protein
LIRAPSLATQLTMCVLTLKSSHRPDGKNADALASSLTCTTANASVNYRGFVPQRPLKVPIAPMGFSHVCARLCLQGGGVAVGGGTVSFSSCTITGNTAADDVRAHAQNFPSPRWEFLLTCPIDSHLSIRVDIWFYQGYVRASNACKLPIAPMGKLLTCLP